MTIPPADVSVLVVDDDATLTRALSRLLASVRFDVTVTHSADEALAVMGQKQVDILVTDLRMEGMDGLTLLERVSATSPHTRAIMMSGVASSRQHDAALRLGAVRVLSKPFDNSEFLDSVRQAADCRVGVRGSIHGLALTDLLQMFHFGRRSVTIRLAGTLPGNIHFKRGELVHAECGTLEGREALKALLSRPSGTVETTAIQTDKHSLSESFDALLLDALREVDEDSDSDLDSFVLAADECEPPRSGLVDSELANRVSGCLPGANAWLVSKSLSEAHTILGDISPSCIMDPVCESAGALARIAVDWSAAECVANGLSLSLLRLSGGDILVVQVDTSMRRGVERFRFQLARLKQQLAS